jgi:enoyl-CoA hydratase/carnithine racemase
LPPTGFCGISSRHGKKLILAAVNGLVVGGGVEVFINRDMVFCSPLAVLSLPDVKVGLSLLGGTLPLLVRKIGRGRATDMVLTGRNVGTDEALMRGLVDKVVENPAEEAIKIAKVIAENSPDAVWASREGIFLGLGGKGSFEAGKEFKNKYWASFLGEGRNSEEGIAAFVKRRKPKLDRN